MRFLISGFLVLTILSCSTTSVANDPVKTPIIVVPQPVSDVEFWLTKTDESVKLEKQNTTLVFGTTFNNYPNIDINDNQNFQNVDGFGYTLTGGSVQVINTLNTAKKQELLQELFGNSASSIGVSYLRVSIGASDLNQTTFSYNDMSAGQTDVNLNNFSLNNDNALILLLKEILVINPNIKIMAAPWSAPTWMKTNASFVGGNLNTAYYNAYAQYFVKYIQAMKAQGITIDAITPQNEPLHNGNNPSMLMSASEQTNFIKNNIGPAFQAANISTKIVIYDHNCDQPNYPIDVLNDATANAFIDGSAFHLYSGSIGALSTVHNSHPNKNVYFTEQWTSSTGSFGGDLKWHLKNVLIGSMRNWSKTALEWNLANDPNFGPHTPGGCTQCKGAITIDNSAIYSKNVAFYIIAHASKFVPAGSVRIESNVVGNINNVAFKTPSGKKILLVENDGNASETFNIKYNNRWVTTTLDGGAVATYVF